MRIRFDRGTLLLEAESPDEDPAQIPGAAWDRERCAWRVPAEAHRELLVRLADRRVRISDEVTPAPLAGTWQLPALRWYQDSALAAWERAGRRGVVALPTGAGKTLVAIAAIARLAVSALVLVPTRVLLDQWARVLAQHWSGTIGRIGDGDHRIGAITVSTYASAVSWAPRIGASFGLVVVDEAHHVGAWCPYEVLEMLPAHARLGLSATPPDDARKLARHVGPVVYALGIKHLEGSALAPYDHERIEIELTPDERARYGDLRREFSVAYAELARGSHDGSWQAFIREASRSARGRRALDAWRAYRALLAYPDGKRRAVRDLLARHPHERILVFTADTATAYAIARELLVIPITHEIGRTERAQALARFAAGDAPVLVSAQVLDEGIDVPDADVAIVVGGTASPRRHVQRIGRVLRPRTGKRAIIYELCVADTTELTYAKRRGTGLAAASAGATAHARGAA